MTSKHLTVTINRITTMPAINRRIIRLTINSKITYHQVNLNKLDTKKFPS